ncbi:patatin-like phospholipase family protein [Leucothrix sargassi]|nr:patatin-like phospholipase family protein [Leucothrix sargassi]
MQRFLIGALSVMISGCATYGVIENGSIESAESTSQSSYSINQFFGNDSKDSSILLSFSGGGTRAAAFSYGVLKALRDTSVKADGNQIRLLDEVTSISAVSGGSFTAAYYGIHGDKTFDTFESVFLRRNIQGGLKKTLLNPINWFDSRGRSELSIDLYEQQVFNGATFADMMRPGAPLILINASDLSKGVRFSFVQEYFDLLCSELLTFPIARAVAASSAVPIVFDPIVVQNHAGCKAKLPDDAEKALEYTDNRTELEQTIRGLRSYEDKEKHKYAHFVDGGITDNLGLRSIYDIIELGGGAKRTATKLRANPVERFVVISVDAAIPPKKTMDLSNAHPSLVDSALAVSDVQLNRYNVLTLDTMEHTIKGWANQLSTPEKRVEPYFIKLSFQDVVDEELRNKLNAVETSFNLPDSQVDILIQAGQSLLYENPEFKRLLKDLKAAEK